MRLKRLFVVFIIFAAIGIQFGDAFQVPGIKESLADIVLPAGMMSADSEVRSSDEFYTAMCDAVRDAKDSIKIRIVEYDEGTYSVDAAFKRILTDNVELGFVSACNATVSRAPGKESAVVELKLLYAYPPEDVIAMRETMISKASDIIGEIIKPGMSDYEKVLAVHDYIIKNSRYDSFNADNDTVPAEEHEAYGVLVDGSGVCDSYAKAVKLLLDKAGVQCMLVEGNKAGALVQSPGTTEHAWNIVKIDGEYYHIDTTWDDVSEDRDSTELVYHYLNLNDEELQKTHVWNRSKYPPCTGTKYNYFVYNNLFTENYAETLQRLVKAISGREEKLMIKISDYTSSKYNIEDMIRNAAEKSKLRNGISAKWIINDLLGILDIEFKY